LIVTSVRHRHAIRLDRREGLPKETLPRKTARDFDRHAVFFGFVGNPAKDGAWRKLEVDLPGTPFRVRARNGLFRANQVTEESDFLNQTSSILTWRM
jgi:hypothetical protein